MTESAQVLETENKSMNFEGTDGNDAYKAYVDDKSIDDQTYNA